MHQHNHQHDHSHAHGHHHHGSSSNIRLAFFLNLAFTILEIFGGIWTNSIAIMSDALHDLGDSFALGLAWYFENLSKKKRDKSYSFGYARFSLLGAVITSLILIMGSAFVLNEAIQRLLAPEEPDAKGMLIFSIVGILVNGAAVLRLKKGGSMNERAAALHLMEDVLGWVAVMIASIVLLFANVPLLDPILSILITAYVLFNVARNLKQSSKIFLQAVPPSLDLSHIKKELLEIPEVCDVHDIHTWSLDGNYNIMTLHLVLKGKLEMSGAIEVKHQARDLLTEHNIQHATIELEMEGEDCNLEGH